MVEGTEAQIAQVFGNVEAIVRAGGGDLSSILKLVVYLTDLAKRDTAREPGCRS